MSSVGNTPWFASPSLISVPQMNSTKVSSVQPFTNCRTGTDIQTKSKEKERNQLKGLSQNSRNTETKGKAL